jgi:hypothetical protein
MNSVRRMQPGSVTRRLVRVIAGIGCCLSTGCVTVEQWLSLGGGCSVAPTSVEYLLNTAIERLSAGGTTFGKELRAATRVPPQSDSIRAHARLIEEDRVCRDMGMSADQWRRSDSYVVLEIGGAYWVRGTSWRYSKVLTPGFTIVGRIPDR